MTQPSIAYSTQLANAAVTLLLLPLMILQSILLAVVRVLNTLTQSASFNRSALLMPSAGKSEKAAVPTTAAQENTATKPKAKKAVAKAAAKVTVAEADTQESSESPNTVIRSGLIAIGIGLLATFIWGAFAPLSSAVVTEGVAKVSGERKVLQHLEGGIIQKLNVQLGDRVSKGQVLLVLDDVKVRSGLDSMKIRLYSEIARATRLIAEQSLSLESPFPSELGNPQTGLEEDEKIAEVIQRERAYFKNRREALDRQVALLMEQIFEVHQETKTLESLRKTTKEGLDLFEKELRANEVLEQRGFVSKLRVTELKRSLIEYQGRYDSQLTDLAKSRQKIKELELKIETLKDQFTQQASDELRGATESILRLTEEIKPHQSAFDRLAIVAPIAGEVISLNFHSEGAVIAPREAIMEIAPENYSLVIEAKVSPEDIRNIQVGSYADVTLTAFRNLNLPPLMGEVAYLGADRLLDSATNSAYYLAHITISQEAIEEVQRRSGQRVEMQPGMDAEVFIKTGERSTWEYMTQPLLKGLQKAMRE